jgi:hypothetical protein
MLITQASVNAFLQQNLQVLMQQYEAVAHLGRGAFIIIAEHVVTTGDETPLGNLDGETTAVYLDKASMTGYDIMPEEVAASLGAMIDRYDPDTQLCFAFGDNEGNWILNTIRIVNPDSN